MCTLSLPSSSAGFHAPLDIGQVLRPEGAVLTRPPIVDLLDRDGVEVELSRATLLFADREAGVLQNGQIPSDELTLELQDHVRTRLAAHEVPREIEYRADLPRTATGKIMRRELKKLEIDRKKET